MRVVFFCVLWFLALFLVEPFSESKTRKIMDSIKLLSQQEATQMDVELMGKEFGFSVDQLMELAGLSVASAVFEFQPSSVSHKPSVLVICGPGNNGGDGLVASRHLVHFGYDVRVLYPKRKDVDIYNRLKLQLDMLNVPFVDEFQEGTDLVVDAIFGYSFKGEIRDPFKQIIAKMAATKSKVVSVDVPSGWDVEKGDVQNTGLNPAALVSLTAPKQCAEKFKGAHYLGGRFVPLGIQEKYSLDTLPKYPGSSQIVRLH